MILSDLAFALSVGIVTSIVFAMFYALHIVKYKFGLHKFNEAFWYIIATIIMLLSVLFSNLAQIASRYPVLDYNNWLTNSLYWPFTKSGVLVSVLLYIRAFTGDAYPKVWLYCSAICAVITILTYVFLV